MTKGLQIIGTASILGAVVVAAVLVNDYRGAAPVSQYTQPKGVRAVQKEGPLGCDFSGTDSPIITGTMPRAGKKSVDLQVPRAYLIGPIYPKDGQLASNGALLMRMHAFSFMPYPPGGAASNGSQRDELMLLLTQLRPLAEVTDFAATFHSGAPQGTQFEEVRQANGLIKYKYVPRPMRKETYIGREAGEITDVITCGVNNFPAVQITPNCEHLTSAHGVDIILTYFSEQLEHWRVLKGNAQKFVECIAK